MSRVSALLNRNGAAAPTGWKPRGPSYAQLRTKVGQVAKRRGEWAGVPVPNDVAKLRVAKTFHHASLDGSGGKPDAYVSPEFRAKGDEDKCTFVNAWTPFGRWYQVMLWREPDGSLHHAKIPSGPGRNAAKILDCIGIAQTFDIEAELKAQEKLRTLIKPHLFDTYRMCGHFLETSPRSGLTYIFRRLGPTIVFTPRHRRSDSNNVGFLVALCLHPIGFYEDTPFGVMVPTDDVIAHLIMMRGDEHFFWRKCNHHGVNSYGAGLT